MRLWGCRWGREEEGEGEEEEARRQGEGRALCIRKMGFKMALITNKQNTPPHLLLPVAFVYCYYSTAASSC
jgi:hypothetical protein